MAPLRGMSAASGLAAIASVPLSRWDWAALCLYPLLPPTTAGPFLISLPSCRVTGSQATLLAVGSMFPSQL